MLHARKEVLPFSPDRWMCTCCFIKCAVIVIFSVQNHLYLTKNARSPESILRTSSLHRFNKTLNIRNSFFGRLFYLFLSSRSTGTTSKNFWQTISSFWNNRNGNVSLKNTSNRSVDKRIAYISGYIRPFGETRQLSHNRWFIFKW